MKLALRTQQIIAEETNVASVVDPLAGSWYVETLTDEIERAVWSYLDRIQAMGGTLAALERGFFQKEIADTAYQTWQETQAGDRVVIGVNKYADERGGAPPVALHSVDPDAERRKVVALQRIKAERDSGAFRRLLADLVKGHRDELATHMHSTISPGLALAIRRQIRRPL